MAKKREPKVLGKPMALKPGQFYDEPVVINYEPGELEKLLKERRERDQARQPRPPVSLEPKIKREKHA